MIMTTANRPASTSGGDGTGTGGSSSPQLEQWCRRVSVLIDQLVAKVDAELRRLREMGVPQEVIDRVAKELDRLVARLQRNLLDACTRLQAILPRIPDSDYLRELARLWKAIEPRSLDVTEALSMARINEGRAQVVWLGGAASRYSESVHDQHEVSDALDTIFDRMYRDLNDLADGLDERNALLGKAMLEVIVSIAGAVTAILGWETVVLLIAGIIAFIAEAILAIMDFIDATKLVDARGRSAIAAQEEWLTQLPRSGWPRPDAGLSIGSSWPDADR